MSEGRPAYALLRAHLLSRFSETDIDAGIEFVTQQNRKTRTLKELEADVAAFCTERMEQHVQDARRVQEEAEAMMRRADLRDAQSNPAGQTFLERCQRRAEQATDDIQRHAAEWRWFLCHQQKFHGERFGKYSEVDR